MVYTFNGETLIKELSKKISNKSAIHAVIGMGYVGLPLAVATASAGFKTICIDVESEKIERIRKGDSYIEDVSSNKLKELLTLKKILPSLDDQKLAKADIISICVPTPLNKNRDPDVSYIEAAAKSIKKHLRKGQLIILVSTTYPGTTREIVLPVLHDSGFEVGKDVFLVYSPERVDPGNVRHGIENTPKVVGGITENCTRIAAEFYRKFIESVIEVSSPETAEMSKLLENIFRAVNIALVNELMLLCDRMKINVWEVIDVAATKPFGFMKFLPGPGLGGHCIPVDPFYLSWKAKQHDFWTEFIELAGRISENIPYFIVEKVFRVLNSAGKNLKGAKILVLGLAYKKDIGDTRHSPSEKIISLLKAEGADVYANDPYTEKEDFKRLGVRQVELDKKELMKADLVLLMTDHSSYDYFWIAENAKLIVDTRNGFKEIPPNKKSNICLI